MNITIEIKQIYLEIELESTKRDVQYIEMLRYLDKRFGCTHWTQKESGPKKIKNGYDCSVRVYKIVAEV